MTLKIALLPSFHTASTVSCQRDRMAVRWLHDHEPPSRRREVATVDLWTHGRVRTASELTQGMESLSAADVCEVFAHMPDAPAVWSSPAIRAGARSSARGLHLNPA